MARLEQVPMLGSLKKHILCAIVHGWPRPAMSAQTQGPTVPNITHCMKLTGKKGKRFKIWTKKIVNFSNYEKF